MNIKKDIADTSIYIRVSKSERDTFRRIVKEVEGETMSSVLRHGFIQPYIAKNVDGTKK